MAVDTERRIACPVIHVVDTTTSAIWLDFREKSSALASVRSLPDDLTGGTSPSPTWDVRGRCLTPSSICPRQLSIGVGRFVAKPVVRKGNIEIRQMKTLSLVFDHRLVDAPRQLAPCKKSRRLSKSPIYSS
jgi:pyruvate/2-oxoglutarate dehydrogenase complex dihydrolipoamide acyltransferase (E2) component